MKNKHGHQNDARNGNQGAYEKDAFEAGFKKALYLGQRQAPVARATKGADEKDSGPGRGRRSHLFGVIT
jgi:hypothetical protein